MMTAVDISLQSIITSKKELYFKTFKKDKIKNIINNFQKKNYSDYFLLDLENGLKNSSIYAVE